MSSIWVDVPFDYYLAQQAIAVLRETATALGDVCAAKASGAQSMLNNWSGPSADSFAQGFTSLMQQSASLQQDLTRFAAQILSAAEQAWSDERARLTARANYLAEQVGTARANLQQAGSPQATEDAQRELMAATRQADEASAALQGQMPTLTVLTMTYTPQPVPTHGPWSSFTSSPGATSAVPKDLFGYAKVNDSELDPRLRNLVPILEQVESQLRSTRMTYLPVVPSFAQRLFGLCVLFQDQAQNVGRIAGLILAADRLVLLEQSCGGPIPDDASLENHLLSVSDQSITQIIDYASSSNSRPDDNRPQIKRAPGDVTDGPPTWRPTYVQLAVADGPFLYQNFGGQWEWAGRTAGWTRLHSNGRSLQSWTDNGITDQYSVWPDYDQPGFVVLFRKDGDWNNPDDHFEVNTSTGAVWAKGGFPWSGPILNDLTKDNPYHTAGPTDAQSANNLLELSKEYQDYLDHSDDLLGAISAMIDVHGNPFKEIPPDEGGGSFFRMEPGLEELYNAFEADDGS